MLLNTTKPVDLDRLKEVKVRIPVRSHMRLLSMKVLQGKPISDAVNEALEDYFTKNGIEADAALRASFAAALVMES